MTRGPVYDNAVRLLASTDLVALCHWLGIDATAESIRVSEALPAATLYADLLVRAGPGRLEHVEFVRAPTGDLLDRMLEYRARILRREPGSLIRQHVLVLAEGRVPRALTDRLTPLDVHITYLRDENPATFPGRPLPRPPGHPGPPGPGPAPHRPAAPGPHRDRHRARPRPPPGTGRHRRRPGRDPPRRAYH